MLGCYALAIRDADKLSPRILLVAILALHVIVLLAPPLFSSDVFSYAAYARMGAIYDVNPYLHGPSAIPLGGAPPADRRPVAAHAERLRAALHRAQLPVRAAQPRRQRARLQGRRRRLEPGPDRARLAGGAPARRRPGAAAVLVGLNPVIVLYGVGGGHNDLMMLAILAAGLYVLMQRRERRGGALIVAATAVKLTAGLLLPFALAAGTTAAATRRGAGSLSARRWARRGRGARLRLLRHRAAAPARDPAGDPVGRRPAQHRRLPLRRGRGPR